MSDVVVFDAGDTQACPGALEHASIKRIVFEHHEGVEQLAEPGDTLNAGETQMLMRRHGRLPFLNPRQHFEEGLLRTQSHTHWQRVDEQPEHAIASGDLRRTSRHGRAEYHIVPAHQPRQQNRPPALYDRVEREAVPARCAHELCRGRFRNLECDGFGKRSSAVLRGRCQECPLLEASQCGLPRTFGDCSILRNEPRKVFAIRPHPRQLVGREELVHQNRYRPTIQQQMMMREEKAVSIGSQSSQCESQQRRLCGLEPVGSVFGEQLCPTLCTFLIVE